MYLHMQMHTPTQTCIQSSKESKEKGKTDLKSVETAKVKSSDKNPTKDDEAPKSTNKKDKKERERTQETKEKNRPNTGKESGQNQDFDQDIRAKDALEALRYVLYVFFSTFTHACFFFFSNQL